jgi:hypothetical protein
MVGPQLEREIKSEIVKFRSSKLFNLVSRDGSYAIKFVQSKWAANYQTPNPLKISDTPAQTWGTATYVTPISFPLSSALYGRIGLVAHYDPTTWRIFDATRSSARLAYMKWAQAQPCYDDLLLTVHSTYTNHYLRNKFRKDFRIDCVLFHPDQEAETHTDRANHIWMAITDWDGDAINSTMSARFGAARFTTLIDEEFLLQENGLPVNSAHRQIEPVTEAMQRTHPNQPMGVSRAKSDPALPGEIVRVFISGGYLHVFIEP